jgi:hypothetical protein
MHKFRNLLINFLLFRVNLLNEYFFQRFCLYCKFQIFKYLSLKKKIKEIDIFFILQ